MRSSDNFAEDVSAHIEQAINRLQHLSAHNAIETPTERELGQQCAILALDNEQLLNRLRYAYDSLVIQEEECQQLRAQLIQRQRNRKKKTAPENVVEFPAPKSQKISGLCIPLVAVGLVEIVAACGMAFKHYLPPRLDGLFEAAQFVYMAVNYLS